MAKNIESQVEVSIEKFQQTVFMIQSLGRMGPHLVDYPIRVDFVNLVEYFGELQASQWDELRKLLNRALPLQIGG